MPDRATIIGWITSSSVRGVAWYLSIHMGIQAAQADSIANALVSAVSALSLAIFALSHSVHERSDLLTAKSQPPKA